MTKSFFLYGGVSAAAMIFAASGARAQDVPDTATADAQAGAEAAAEEEEIIVIGIRGSIRAAIDLKRNLDVVADVITAEDIGKFPDKNVAEALQRVPGIVINREFGEGERVSLRGTAPNLTKTLINGHSVATADWFVLEQLAATRSFNYLTLPSEIVGKVEVFKSPRADLEEGGLGGTINVSTRNPLDLKAFTVSASLQGVYSELADKVDPQVSGLVSWKNDAETFGVLVGGVYQKRNIRRDGVETLGYSAYGVPATIDNPVAGGPPLPNPNFDAALVGSLFPSLIGSALFEQERERYGANIGIQLKPSDAFEINLTGLYSRFNADNSNQNYLAWGSNALGGGGRLSNGVVKNGTIVSGRVDSTPGGRAVVFDAFDRKAFSEVYSGDVDLIWRPSDQGTLHVKGGYTEAHGDTSSQLLYEGGAPGGFTYDLTGRTPQVGFIGIDPNNPASLAFDFGNISEIKNLDKEKYFYVDYEHEVDFGPISAIKFGGKYTDHDRVTSLFQTTYTPFFVPLGDSASGVGCGGRPCTSADFFSGRLTPDNFLGNIKQPGTLDSFWLVDRGKLQTIYNGQPANNRTLTFNPSENYSVNEKTFGGYAMAKFGGDDWRGNFGVRVIKTEQTSRGNQIGVAPGPGVVVGNPFGSYRPVTVERSYTDVLPSLNIAFDVQPTLTLRVAAGRVIARPDYTDIVPRVNLNPGSLTAGGGDPSVDPYRANQFDVSLEYYPDRDTALAAAFYYKDINAYITDTITQERFPIETPTPNLARCTLLSAANNLNDCLFDVNRRANGAGGRNQGVELQASRGFGGGFGVLLNYTYSDAKADDGRAVPYNSKHVANVSGFFENDLLSARLSYNYRSTFFITFDRAVPLNQKATESLDGSFSINVTDNVAITADAINLTNEKIEQFSGTTDRPRAIYDNGRQFYFGARFRF